MYIRHYIYICIYTHIYVYFIYIYIYIHGDLTILSPTMVSNIAFWGVPLLGRFIFNPVRLKSRELGQGLAEEWARAQGGAIRATGRGGGSRQRLFLGGNTLQGVLPRERTYALSSEAPPRVAPAERSGRPSGLVSGSLRAELAEREDLLRRRHEHPARVVPPDDPLELEAVVPREEAHRVALRDGAHAGEHVLVDFGRRGRSVEEDVVGALEPVAPVPDEALRHHEDALLPVEELEPSPAEVLVLRVLEGGREGGALLPEEAAEAQEVEVGGGHDEQALQRAAQRLPVLLLEGPEERLAAVREGLARHVEEKLLRDPQGGHLLQREALG